MKTNNSGITKGDWSAWGNSVTARKYPDDPRYLETITIASRVNNKANAALIEKAPKLLSALEEIERRCNDALSQNCPLDPRSILAIIEEKGV